MDLSSAASASLTGLLAHWESLQVHGDQAVYLVPIRHHSPACAWALQHLIHDVQPAAVLIEGPADLNPLEPLLQDPQTQPPIAVLCHWHQAKSKLQLNESIVDADESPAEPTIHAAYVPFCDYSPEWVALKTAQAVAAQVAFIDLPWAEQAQQRASASAGTEIDSLMAERYLAHSQYLSQLAHRAGCRDHAELWDHLFELHPSFDGTGDRSTEQRAARRKFFADVLAYCAMARQDYEDEVLHADGTLAREQAMFAAITHWRQSCTGPLVVVTGGFHTPALIALLQGQNASEADSNNAGKPKKPNGKTKAQTKTPAKTTSTAASQAWLIRYGFEPLDALNGYAAGMPSPAFYQAVWQALQQGGREALAQVSLDFLVQFARQQREIGLSSGVSTPEVAAAWTQAQGLASLRGHLAPGRYDLIDALRSCFLKQADHDGDAGFRQDVRRLLCGTRLGDLPSQAGQPPLVENARRQARALGFRLDDSTPRQSKLDVYRKPKHRERSRWLHLLNDLNIPFGTLLNGPDFLTGTGQHLLFETWQTAWSPATEARLIELSARGQSLQAVATQQLRQQVESLQAQGQARNAASAVVFVVRACRSGLHDQLPALMRLVHEHVSEDADLKSLVSCGHRLALLWRAQIPMGLQDDPILISLLHQVWQQALLYLPNLSRCAVNDEADAIATLVRLRELSINLQLALSENLSDLNLPWWHHILQTWLNDTPEASQGVCGAAAAILVLAQVWQQDDLVRALDARLAPGAAPGASARFLTGLLQTAPELLLHQQAVQACLNRCLASWDDETFLALLPELRPALAQLKPLETATLAKSLVALNSGGASELQAFELALNSEVDERLMLYGARLQAQVQAMLAQDGLASWCSEESGVKIDVQPRSQHV